MGHGVKKIVYFRCSRRVKPNDTTKQIWSILFGIFASIESVKKNAITRDKTNR